MISLTREELARKIGTTPLQLSRDGILFTTGRLVSTFIKSALDDDKEILFAGYAIPSSQPDEAFCVKCYVDKTTYAFSFRENHQTGKLDLLRTTVSRGLMGDEDFSYREVNHETGDISGEEIFVTESKRKPSDIERILCSDRLHEVLFDNTCAMIDAAVTTKHLKTFQKFLEVRSVA